MLPVAYLHMSHYQPPGFFQWDRNILSHCLQVDNQNYNLGQHTDLQLNRTKNVIYISSIPPQYNRIGNYNRRMVVNVKIVVLKPSETIANFCKNVIYILSKLYFQHKSTEVPPCPDDAFCMSLFMASCLKTLVC